MKKLLLLLVAVIGLSSCNKDSQEPRPIVPEGDGQPISASFTGEVEDDSPRALEGTVNGSPAEKLLSFRGKGDVYGWVYVVDKDGEYAKEYKKLVVSDDGRKLSYEGTIATTRTSGDIDNATAKVSIYVGLDASGLFTNKGFKSIENVGHASGSSLGDDFAILKSENNALTHVSSSTSGKYHEYKASNGKLRFSMAGSLILIRFRNEFQSPSHNVLWRKVFGVLIKRAIGAPLPRDPAIIDQMRAMNLHIDKIKIEVENGKTQLKATNEPSPGFISNSAKYPNGYFFSLAETVSIPTNTNREVNSPFDNRESVIAFYTPISKRVDERAGELAAFSFHLQNEAHYKEERFEDGLFSSATHRSVTFRSELQEGHVHRALLNITYKLVEGGGKN